MKTFLSLILIWIACILWWKILDNSVALPQTNIPVVNTLESIMQDSYRITEQTRFYEEELAFNYRTNPQYVMNNINHYLLK